MSPEESKQFLQNQENLKNPPNNIGLEKSLRISSNIETENLHQIRQQMRINKFDHKNYNPSLDLYQTRKLLQDVYKSNELHQQIGNKPEYLTKHVS